MVDNNHFIKQRKQAIEQSPLEHKFFLTYNFPPYVREFQDCLDLIGYYLLNALSQDLNVVIDVAIAGIHREFHKVGKGTINHAHIIGCSSKDFWSGDVQCVYLKDFLDSRCWDFVSRRRPLGKPDFQTIATEIRSSRKKHRNRALKSKVAKRETIGTHKTHRFKCIDYQPIKEGVRYVFSHHTLVPYNNPVFDRRRSQRRKKKKV